MVRKVRAKARENSRFLIGSVLLWDGRVSVETDISPLACVLASPDEFLILDEHMKAINDLLSLSVHRYMASNPRLKR